ncbi:MULTISPECIES: DUF1127 domain-containing protein [unclassified Aureimonas]|uniref:DUF1127 domain-containing protein n=1 Tax=unclassified Aureimonas TaxID=2615206 RepID=UPI0006F62A6C|nr:MULTISPECIES: DUF1127 domain-containing protein [unclassified Aureimonas]KQT69766.1 hypothetical protein ASG62_01220 [Aureimonas sp. Leaf427]KQT76082.1 hypothetical protein ASG54_15000 [Aureimonas sp. Leaf460]
MTIFTRQTPTRRLTFHLPSPMILWAAARAMVKTAMNRRAARHVGDLPDYLLTDIGLKRDDVHEALQQSWRSDPTYQLAMTAAKRRRSA